MKKTLLSVMIVSCLLVGRTAMGETKAAPEAATPAPAVEGVPVAEEGADTKKSAEDKPADKLTGGVIASYGSYEKKASVNAVGQNDVPGDKTSPVSGSVKRDGDRCIVTVTNQSEKEAYSVSFEVVGYRGSAKAFSRYFSARLEPKGSSDKTVNGCDSDVNVQVVMKSGRRIGK